MFKLANTIRLYVIFYLIALTVHLPAQVAYIDSLKAELKKANNDTVKCGILSRLAENAPDEEWPAFNRQLKTLAEKNLKNEVNDVFKRVYTRYLANAITNEGSIAQNEGDNKKALYYYRKSATLHTQINYKAGLATSINNIGSIHERNGNADSAIYYYKMSLHLSRESKDISGEANSLNNIGSVLSSRGNIVEALEFYEKSLFLCEKIGDEFGASLALSKIGVIYYSQGEKNKSIEYWQKALSICERIGFKQGGAEVANAIGVYYYGLKKVSVALKYYEKCLSLNREFNNKHGISLSLLNIGSVYEYNGDLSKALEYYQQALTIMEEIDNKDLISNTLTNISQVYLKQNKIEEAFTCCKRAFDLAQHLGFPKEISEASELLSRIYKLKGNYKEAFAMQELYVKMHDSINNLATKKSALRSQFKYEYEKKIIADSIKTADEKKLFEAKLKQERTNKYMLLLGFVLVILIGFIVFQRNRNIQKHKVLQLRNKIASDLHDDIGSALSSIKMFAGVAKLNPVKAAEANVIEKIEETSRETIENMSDIVWSINPKNDNFKLVLEKMRRFGESICSSSEISFSFLSEAGIEKINLNVEQRKNLFLIYKEALNNAVKYSAAKNISVELTRKNKILCMHIKDDGKGIEAGKMKSGNGIGNMKQRAKDINAIVLIDSEENKGTTIKLEFKTT